MSPKIIKALESWEFLKNKNYQLIPLKESEECRTFELRVGDFSYLVRINHECSKHGVENEQYILKLLQQNEIDWAPKPIYMDNQKLVSISEFYQGCISVKEIKDLIILRKIGEKLFPMVQSLHELKTLTPQNKFSKLLNSKLKDCIEKRILTKEEAEKIWSVFLKSKEIYQKPECFIHEDIQPMNMVYNLKAEKLHLIDFEFASFGDPYYDWVHMYKTMPKEMLKPFKSLYDSIKNPYFQIYDLFFELNWYLTDIRRHEENSEKKKKIKLKIEEL